MGRRHSLWSPFSTWLGLTKKPQDGKKSGYILEPNSISETQESTSPGIWLETQQPFPPGCSPCREEPSPNEVERWDEKQAVRKTVSFSSFVTHEARNLHTPVSYVPTLILNTLHKGKAKKNKAKSKPTPIPELKCKAVQKTVWCLFLP